MLNHIIPIMRRFVFEPLHSRKVQSPKVSYWKLLEKTQYLSEEELKKIQWERFKETIDYVYRNNSYYRKRFHSCNLKPENIVSPADIKRIPLLKKEDIRNAESSLISNGHDKSNLLKFKTGGSTGKSLDIYLTEECSELRNGCARRHDRWTGWEVGEPIGAVWGNPVLPTTIKEKLKSFALSPTIYLDTMNLTKESVEAFANKWKIKKPTLLFGHAHSLYILSKYINKYKIKNIKPKGILSTSMMLMPHERLFIEKVFNKRVFDRYGCEEVSLIGSECEQHCGFHLNIEHLYIEFIDDHNNDVEPGSYGKIVVTDLMNKAMPFIRYVVEDMGIPSSRKCVCGRGLPLMEKVTGRVADFLQKNDGTLIAGVSLIENTLTKIEGLEQMQIIQKERDLIQLNIVTGESFKQIEKNTLVQYFKDLFGSNTTIDLNYTDEISPEKNGKYRFSINKIGY